MRLFHACPLSSLALIQSEGLRAPVCLTDDIDMATYYGECLKDDGQDFAVVEVDLEAIIEVLGESSLAVDYPSIDEPITTVLGCSEDEIQEHWAEAEGNWRECLEIVRSVRVKKTIPPSLISLPEPEPIPLTGI